MRSSSHSAAEKLAARAEAGEDLDVFDSMCLEAHLEECEECAARHRRLNLLLSALRTSPSTAPISADRRIIAQALMQVGRVSSRVQAGSASRRRFAWVAIAAAILVTTGLGASLRVSTDAPVAGTAFPRQQGRTPAPVVAGTPKPPPSEPQEDHPEAPQVAKSTGGETPCRGVRLAPGSGTNWKVTAREEDVCRLELQAGTLDVHVDPGAHVRLSIDTPDATVRVIGTVFRVQVQEPRTEVTVYRGKVALDSRGGTRTVTSGRRALLDRSSRGLRAELLPAEAQTQSALAQLVADSVPEAASTTHAPGKPRAPRSRLADRRRHVKELRGMLHTGRIHEARAEAESRASQASYVDQGPDLLTIIAESYVMEGRHEQALDAYRRVWSESRSATAANAVLASASINLDRLDRPAEALKMFERYLRDYPGGSLQEVAAVGRCRSLWQAGRQSQARSCGRAYLAVHPDGRFRQQMEWLKSE